MKKKKRRMSKSQEGESKADNHTEVEKSKLLAIPPNAHPD